MTSFGILLIYLSGVNIGSLTFEQKRAIFLIVFSGTFLLPLCLIPLLLLFRMVSSVHMNTLKERVLPLFFTLIVYLFTFRLMSGFLPGALYLFMTGVIISVGLVFAVSFFWKISAHMVGVGGLAGLLISLSFFFSVNLAAYIMLVLIAAGLLGFSRIELKAHSPSQVYTGFLSGTAVMIMVFYLS